MSIPSTSLSLTARSTVLSVSLAESTIVFRSGEAVEKAARWTMEEVWEAAEEVKTARGTPAPKVRRAAESSGRNDILVVVWCVVCVSEFGLVVCEVLTAQVFLGLVDGMGNELERGNGREILERI